MNSMNYPADHAEQTRTAARRFSGDLNTAFSTLDRMETTVQRLLSDRDLLIEAALDAHAFIGNLKGEAAAVLAQELRRAVDKVRATRNTAHKPLQTVEVSVGYVHPRDSAMTEWKRPVALARPIAAEALRTARRSRLKIEKSEGGGYEISGLLHPGWRYAS